MKTAFSILSVFAAIAAQNAAFAHDALVPHTHPHATSMLPGVDVIGVAALVLALGVIAFTYLKRG